MIFIPIQYQLLAAYHPVPYLPTSHLVLSIPTPTPPITTPTKTIGSVLGTTTTETPAIGGESQFVSLALLGDSMIDTIPSDTLLTSLHQLFPDTQFNIFNYGYGSTTIESGLLRLTQKSTYLSEDNPPILDLQPNIIVIESFAYNNFGNSTAGLERHRLALQKIVNTIKKQAPQSLIVLAATIAPNSLSFTDGIKDLHFSALDKTEKANTIKLYLQNLVNFAKDNNLPLVDAYHPSLKSNEGLPQLISSTDHLHPSSLGAEFFSDLLADTIAKYNLL